MQKGSRASEAFKAKMRSAQKARWATPSKRAQMMMIHKERCANLTLAERRAQIAAAIAVLARMRSTGEIVTSEAVKERLRSFRPTAAHRAQLSKSQKLRWARMDDEGRLEFARRYWARVRSYSVPAGETYIEGLMREALSRAGITAVSQVRAGRYRLDLVTDARLVVECDGEQHDPEKDKVRDTWVLTHVGLPTLRFSAATIKADSAGCAELVRFALRGPRWL